MKRILLCAVLVLGIFLAKAQNYNDTNVVTPFFKIVLYVDTMQYYSLEGSCDLLNVDTIYAHSGAGDSVESTYNNIVGHWGQPDSVGEMIKDSAGVYSICFNVRDYYAGATQDTFNVGGAGQGPLTADETVYNIGIVFRDGNCPINTNTGRPDCEGTTTGKDPICENINIENLPSGTPVVEAQSTQDIYTAVTASFVNGCPILANPYGGFYPVGYNGISNVVTSSQDLLAFPDPFINNLNIQFKLNSSAGNRLELYDILGNKVADYSASLVSGNNSFIWNGSNLAGNAAPAGVYMLKLSANGSTYVKKVIKQ